MTSFTDRLAQAKGRPSAVATATVGMDTAIFEQGVVAGWDAALDLAIGFFTTGEKAATGCELPVAAVDDAPAITRAAVAMRDATAMFAAALIEKDKRDRVIHGLELSIQQALQTGIPSARDQVPPV